MGGGERYRYVDTSATWARSWWDLVLADDDIRRQGHQITIVVLRRYIPKVMASYQRLKVWDFPNSIALRWSTTPHFANLSLTRNLSSWDESTTDDLLVGSIIENEAMSQWFMDTSQILRFNYSVLEVRLEDIVTESGATAFLEELPGGCSHDARELRSLLIDKSDVVKEPVAAQAPERLCENLRRNVALVDDYVRRAKEMSIELPPLPSLEPDAGIVEKCPGVMQECALPLGTTRYDQRGVGGVSILEPSRDAVLMDRGEQGTNLSWIVTLPLGVARAGLHVERHWIVNHRVAVVQGGDDEMTRATFVIWESFVDDEILVRRSAVNWVEAKKAEVLTLPPFVDMVAAAQKQGFRSGAQGFGGVGEDALSLEVSVEVLVWDVDDMQFLGRGNRTLKRADLRKVAGDSTRFTLEPAV